MVLRVAEVGRHTWTRVKREWEAVHTGGAA
jgi:hypothetical protein